MREEQLHLIIYANYSTTLTCIGMARRCFHYFLRNKSVATWIPIGKPICTEAHRELSSMIVVSWLTSVISRGYSFRSTQFYVPGCCTNYQINYLICPFATQQKRIIHNSRVNVENFCFVAFYFAQARRHSSLCALCARRCSCASYRNREPWIGASRTNATRDDATRQERCLARVNSQEQKYEFGRQASEQLALILKHYIKHFAVTVNNNTFN